MATNGNKIELTSEHFVLLHNLIVRTGSTPEEILSSALRQYDPDPAATVLPRKNRQPRESLFERLERQGVVGCLKDGPPDLSTNPKYMEGFGES